MNETINNILSRRSIRKYTDEPVSDEHLNEIVECGLYAASGGNHQVVKIVVVQNKDILEEMTTLVRNEFLKMELNDSLYWNTAIKNAHEHPHYDFRFKAPTVILVTAPKDWHNGMADSALAIANMQIAATSLGLGTCYVNQINWLNRVVKNKPMEDFLMKIGIETDYRVYGTLALGHPSICPKAAPRKENRVIRV